MFMLFSISRGLEFSSGNQTPIYENSASKGFKNIKVSGEISNNWPNHLLGTNVYKTFEFHWWFLLTISNSTSISSLIWN